MSLKDRTEATAKNIEGKVQEAVGDLTGDPKAQAEGISAMRHHGVKPFIHLLRWCR